MGVWGGVWGAEAGNSFREKLSCVTRENICNLLTAPRHREFKTAAQEKHNLAGLEADKSIFRRRLNLPPRRPARTRLMRRGNAIRPYKAACVHHAALFTKSHV